MFDHSAASLASAGCGRTIETAPIVPPARNSSAIARARTELSTEMSTGSGPCPIAMPSISAEVQAPLRAADISPNAQVESHTLGWVWNHQGEADVARTPLAGRVEELAADVRAGYTRRDALK